MSGRMTPAFILLAALINLPLSAGCASIPGFGEPPLDTMVLPYSSEALRNYRAGRDLASAGRFELAREHYLLALAGTRDPDLQDALDRELESVNLIIQTLR